jgi:hypothetical protein
MVFFVLMRIIEATPGQETTCEDISPTGEVAPVLLPERFKGYDDDIRQLFILSTISASEYLDYIVSSEHVEDVGAYIHELWREVKRTARDDPTNPYIGYGPTRVKVSHLDEETRRSLGIAEDAAPDADIYHPLDRPYEELEEDTRNKNAVPVIVLCNFLGDIVLDEQATLIDLENTIQALLDGNDPENFDLLKRIHHIAFLAGEARVSARGYGENERSDFHLYSALPEHVQELDGTTVLPVGEWIVKEFQKGSGDEDSGVEEADSVARVDDIALGIFRLIDNQPEYANQGDERFTRTAAEYIRDVTLADCSNTRIVLVKKLMLDEILIAQTERGVLEVTDQGRVRSYQLEVAHILARARDGFYPHFVGEIDIRRHKKTFIEKYPHLAHLI